jgi:secreted Zn-dependent insulinase-like peptidase
MFSDSVTEETYEADLAELSFRFYQGGEWIGIMARGFSDKLAVFTETMLGKLMQFEVNEGRFNEVVDQVSHSDPRLGWILIPADTDTSRSSNCTGATSS